MDESNALDVTLEVVREPSNSGVSVVDGEVSSAQVLDRFHQVLKKRRISKSPPRFFINRRPAETSNLGTSTFLSRQGFGKQIAK